MCRNESRRSPNPNSPSATTHKPHEPPLTSPSLQISDHFLFHSTRIQTKARNANTTPLLCQLPCSLQNTFSHPTGQGNLLSCCPLTTSRCRCTHILLPALTASHYHYILETWCHSFGTVSISISSHAFNVAFVNIPREWAHESV